MARCDEIVLMGAMMSTKELIHQEIDNLDEAYLEELYQNIRHFAQVKEQSEDSFIEVIERPGGPCAILKGTRVAVRDIISYIQIGETPESLVKGILPNLTITQVYAALSYYDNHQTEIDRELQANTEEAARAYLREHLGEKSYFMN